MASLYDKALGSTRMLERGLDAAWYRNQVISNNIANANTPNFKSSKVEFESIFAQAVDDALEPKFKLKRTREKHMNIGDASIDPESVLPVVVENDETTMRMDGNNVDIEYEMTELAKNTIYYNTLQEKTSAQLKRIKYAITGRG